LINCFYNPGPYYFIILAPSGRFISFYITGPFNVQVGFVKSSRPIYSFSCLSVHS